MCDQGFPAALSIRVKDQQNLRPRKTPTSEYQRDRSTWVHMIEHRSFNAGLGVFRRPLECMNRDSGNFVTNSVKTTTRTPLQQLEGFKVTIIS